MANESRDIKRLMIRGAVQKIGFRVWVEREALALGLKGWVRNRVDGAVEVVISGAPDAVEKMIERCWQGPPLAKVEVDRHAGSDGARPRLPPPRRVLFADRDEVAVAVPDDPTS